MHFNKTPLMHACANKDALMAIELIDKEKSNADYLEQQDDQNNTALIYACMNKLENVAINLLITGHAKPTHVNSAKETAFIIGCKYDLHQVMTLLIARKEVDFNMIDQYGQTPLLYALNSKYGCNDKIEEQCLLTLIEVSYNTFTKYDFNHNTVLMAALLKSCPRYANKVVEIAIKHKVSVDPSHINIRGYTAFLYTCNFRPKDTYIIEYLLQTNKSLPYKGDNRQISALMYALWHHVDDKIIIKLIGKYSKQNLLRVDYQGKNVLMYACNYGSFKIVKILLDLNIFSLDYQDIFEKTALMYALEGRKEEIALMLLETDKACPEYICFGHTALTQAAYYGLTKVVNIIIK